MGGLGGSSLDNNNKKVIGKFLSTTKNQDTTEEKFTIQKGVKISERQETNLELIKIKIGTTNDALALRWVLDQLWELKGAEIEEDAKKIKSIHNK